MASDKLTIKQEKYAQGLFTGLSQREAYKQAYDAQNMTDKSIDEKACELAANVKVAERLDELKDQFTRTSMITKEYILSSLNKVAERCMKAEPVMMKVGKELVESGEYQFDSSGANKSLELLGKHLKMFTERVESTNDNNNLNATVDFDSSQKLITNATQEELEQIAAGDMSPKKQLEIINRS